MNITNVYINVVNHTYDHSFDTPHCYNATIKLYANATITNDVTKNHDGRVESANTMIVATYVNIMLT